MVLPFLEGQAAAYDSFSIRPFRAASCILLLALLGPQAREPIYGLAMLEELKRHGYALSPGTLYQILHSLENRGYLQQETGVVDGRVRKYYTATEVGRNALADVKKK